MTEKQQTAVQWLLSQIFYMDNDFHAELLNSKELKQALEMEREQIEDAHHHGKNNGMMYSHRNYSIITENQYFTDTYQTES